MQEEKFEMYCLVELMGRQRIAGMVSEITIAGHGYLRVDVMETTKNPKFTRFISPSSIYALNPIDEQTCKWYTESLQVKPIDSWDISEFMAKAEQQKQLKAAMDDNGYNEELDG